MIELVKKRYELIKERVNKARKLLNRPLSLAEKVIFSHLFNGVNDEIKAFKRGVSYIELMPDRVAMQDATAQMALLQFMLANRETTFVPTSVHCDHLIEAKEGVDKDLPVALKENKEVYDFLLDVSRKYGIEFWKPGYGIIHQVILENYAFPGGLIIGTDSHTPNSGGVTMMGVGVGGADAVDVMVGMAWEVKLPKIIGVKLTGKLSDWASPKDVILKLLGILTVKGGTGCVIEYFGEGCSSISATGKATICNMGAELGATSSIFPYDDKIADYLIKTGRSEIVKLSEEIRDELRADDGLISNPESYYDKVIEINLSELKPHINGPFTPDISHTVDNIDPFLKENGYPIEISAALIGSCTNSSYEDLDKAANIAIDALNKGLKLKAKLYISPGSEKVKKTIEKNGQLDVFKRIGAVILANACGPCIGMWNRQDIKKGTKNSIIHSFNRNFAKRADGNPETHAFIASPEMVMALAFSGTFAFNPEKDFLVNENGEKVKLNIPFGNELPAEFFDVNDGRIIEKKNIEIKIDPSSDRLAFLTPFERWNGEDFIELPILLKVKGKCTTDHISMAGEWLRYRGHLDKISDNLFLGATNAYNGETGKAKNIFTGEYDIVSKVARDYKKRGVGWVVIGDENYGEGSSREHAAMEPRYLGCKAIIVKSFARIHETNLKKQGILALTFSNPIDYDKIREDDLVTISLKDFKEGKPLKMLIKHRDGTTEEIQIAHTYNQKQIEWFKAGSALNLIANKK
ncbi:MAG: aconitate hydratase [Brevinematales bacterium]|nr:aconitate hydratase [Brevinematales bacterium]